MKIVGIVFGVLLVIIGGSTMMAMLNNNESNEYEFSLENIDDTKFPIADYLYSDYVPPKQSQPTIIQPTPENIEALIDGNQTLKDTNATLDFNNTQTTTQETIQKTTQKEEDLSNKVMNILNPTESQSNTPTSSNKYTDDIFKDTDKINQILSKRHGNSIIESSQKIGKPTISKEYGDDAISNLNVRELASNEHKLYRTLTAFKNIPATLTTAISSDVGGKVMAKVEEDIFAQMGKAILIPKGSQVMGFYQNNNKIGEYRLRIIWTRILTPHGININLTDAQGTDLAGANGVIGNLDSKYWQRYGIPLALSTLSNALIITMNNQTQRLATQSGSSMNAYTTAQLMQNAQSDVSNIMAQIINQQVKIQPTIRIEAGSRIFISSSKDIFFPIPKENEILASFFNEIKVSKPSIEDNQEIGE